MENEKVFFEGFICGLEYARRHPTKFPAAHNIACLSKEDDTRRRASAIATTKLCRHALISDADSAVTVYSTITAAGEEIPFELVLGAVYFAGKIEGKRIERARRAK